MLLGLLRGLDQRTSAQPPATQGAVTEERTSDLVPAKAVAVAASKPASKQEKNEPKGLVFSWLTTIENVITAIK